LHHPGRGEYRRRQRVDQPGHHLVGRYRGQRLVRRHARGPPPVEQRLGRIGEVVGHRPAHIVVEVVAEPGGQRLERGRVGRGQTGQAEGRAQVRDLVPDRPPGRRRGQRPLLRVATGDHPVDVVAVRVQVRDNVMQVSHGFSMESDGGDCLLRMYSRRYTALSEKRHKSTQPRMFAGTGRIGHVVSGGPPMTTRPFRFGLNLIPSGSKADLQKACRMAEDLGFDLVTVSDYITLSLPPVNIAPWTTVPPFFALLAAAEVTSRVKLGTYSLNASMYRP